MNEKDPKKSIVLIDSLFNMKIEKILENNRDKFLVNELIEYVRDFHQVFSKDMRDNTKDNLGCTALLNKTNAYKIIIKSIITDLYVLKHFSHFYLPHYITASGRCLTTSNTVQLQSLKFIKSLIKFKKQPEMNNEQLMKLKRSY